MPYGAPPPPPPATPDETSLPDHRPVSQVGVLAGVALAAGASVQIPGVREDYGITQAIIGVDVASPMSIDYVPLVLEAGASEHYDFAEPVITGQPHIVTNNGAAGVHLYLYVVAKQTRTRHHGHHHTPTEADQG